MARKRLSNAVKAFRDGIGAHLLELGFEKKTERLYLRDDGRFSEAVDIELDVNETFREYFYIFDREFDRVLAQAFPDLFFRSGLTREPIEYRIRAHTWQLMTDADDAAQEKFEAGLKPWNFIRRRWRRPRRMPERFSCLTKSYFWSAADDPAECAQQSLAIWKEFMEPWRDAARSDRKVFADRYMTRRIFLSHPELQRIAVEVYAGDVEAAKAQVAHLRMLAMSPPPEWEEAGWAYHERQTGAEYSAAFRRRQYHAHQRRMHQQAKLAAARLALRL